MAGWCYLGVGQHLRYWSRLAGDNEKPRNRLATALRLNTAAKWYAIALLLPAGLFLIAQGVSQLVLPGHLAELPGDSNKALLVLTAVSLAANPWEEPLGSGTTCVLTCPQHASRS